MTADEPIVRDIVLVGGSHAHVEVLRKFAMRPQPGTRLTLITRDVDTPYSGMLPGYLAGYYTFDDCHINLRPLCRAAGARLYHTSALGIDLTKQQVLCKHRPPVDFDYLSLSTGSTPYLGNVDGAGHILPIKPVDQFLERWSILEYEVVRRAGAFHVVVIGGGVGGVEVSLCLRNRLIAALRKAGHGTVQPGFSIITDGDDLLEGLNDSARQHLANALATAGIQVHTGYRVVGASAGVLQCRPPLGIACDAAIAVTRAGPPAWLRDTDLDLDDNGFVRVGATLQSLSHPNVFAAGDVASFTPRDLPKNGVYAVRQGVALAENLRRVAESRRPRPFRPQRHTLALISTGGKHAVAAYGKRSLEGSWLWTLKDWIDRRWMRRYQELDTMDNAAPEMRCGGCGSKIPAAVLAAVLEDLRRADPDGVTVGLNHPDDAAVSEAPPGMVLVQSVDQFRSFIEDPYTFGRIAANHCLSDIYAMGAVPKIAMAMVTLPYAGERKMEADLRELLGGALEVLDAAQVGLVGGHTSEAAELSFGLSVTGYAPPDALLLKSGLAIGDRLILTKPVGTGVLLAADMRGLARSQWIDDAIDTMLVSNQQAVDILHKHRASACTDITGFGVLGHLVEMLQASAVHAELDPAAVPTLPGSRDLLAQGIQSTLQPANRAFTMQIDEPGTLRNGDDVLLDPQTSGGLLVGIPRARAKHCLRDLVKAGYLQPAIIGEVIAGDAGRLRFKI